MRISVPLVLLTIIPALATGQDLPSSYPPPGDRDAYYLTFSAADSTTYDPLYSDQAVRDSIDAEYANRHDGAKAIEDYALEQQDIDFLERIEKSNGRDEWNVTLTSADTLRIRPQEISSFAVDLTFEHYHRAHKLIVFQSHWVEGGAYVLVSRRDGDATRTFGPPIFSPSGHWFATFNEDTIAGYSPNGLQLLKLQNDEITKVLSYRIDSQVGGPTNCTWMNDTTFRLELFKPGTVRGGRSSYYTHYQVNIHAVD